jgi:hypothetical protein
MPRKCENGTQHQTYGDIRGCGVCQRNGQAAQVHARFGNEDLVDPVQSEQKAAPRATPTPAPKRRR